MREPASPNASNPAAPEGPELPAVSIPDRRRIDSDVRAFLREPSTPWIVFDREGRPPSQLAVGEVLSVALSSVIPDHGFFPATAIIDAGATGGSSVTRLEPSSLAVAADLSELMDDGLGAAPIPMLRLSQGVLGAAAAILAVVSTLAVGGLALRSTTSADARTARAAEAASPRSFGSPVPTDVPPPDLDAKPAVPAAVTTSVATSAAAAATPAPARDESPAKAGKPRFARLSVVGSRDVFLDGKRLLGHGPRNFTVICGTHSIAIGTRTDGHDVDVPCNSELVVGR